MRCLCGVQGSDLRKCRSDGAGQGAQDRPYSCSSYSYSKCGMMVTMVSMDDVELARMVEGRLLGVSGRGRRARLAVGLSQKTTSSHIGVSLQSVNKWETGHATPLPVLALLWLDAVERYEAAVGVGSGSVPVSSAVPVGVGG